MSNEIIINNTVIGIIVRGAFDTLTKKVAKEVWKHLYNESQTSVKNYEDFNKYILTLDI